MQHKSDKRLCMKTKKYREFFFVPRTQNESTLETSNGNKRYFRDEKLHSIAYSKHRKINIRILRKTVHS